DDVMLRPYEIKPVQLAADNPFAEVMPILQSFVAASRTFAADAFLMQDFKAQIDMSELGQTVAVNMAVPTYGARGMRGSDLDAAFIRNVSIDVKTSAGAPAAAPAADVSIPPMNITGGVDYIGMQGTKLDKLAGYVARGEWPARTVTDLLSYGLVTVKNH